MCPKNSAVSGMRLTIERYSNYIKGMSVHCRDVGNIASICEAHDERSHLFICDATEAVGGLICKRSKKVGISERKSTNEAYSNEHTFYKEFGFEIGASGFGLSANFKRKVGQSRTTKYNWATSQELTWEEERTLTVAIEAPPGCRTTVSEIVGTCSFMTVRPDIFYRNDTCPNGRSILTPVNLPAHYSSKVFTSAVSI